MHLLRDHVGIHEDPRADDATHDQHRGVKQAKLPGHAADNTMEQGGSLMMQWLSYVLSTGANWAGPIGRFSIEIKQGKADIVSACPIPGVTLRRDGGSLKGEAVNFTPRSEVKVVYVFGYCTENKCPDAPR